MRRRSPRISVAGFPIYHSTDVRGVEIGGAAKNVLAIAAGIVLGLDWAKARALRLSRVALPSCGVSRDRWARGPRR